MTLDGSGKTGDCIVRSFIKGNNSDSLSTIFSIFIGLNCCVGARVSLFKEVKGTVLRSVTGKRSSGSFTTCSLVTISGAMGLGPGRLYFTKAFFKLLTTSASLLANFVKIEFKSDGLPKALSWCINSLSPSLKVMSGLTAWIKSFAAFKLGCVLRKGFATAFAVFPIVLANGSADKPRSREVCGICVSVLPAPVISCCGVSGTVFAVSPRNLPRMGRTTCFSMGPC